MLSTTASKFSLLSVFRSSVFGLGTVGGAAGRGNGATDLPATCAAAAAVGLRTGCFGAAGCAAAAAATVGPGTGCFGAAFSAASAVGLGTGCFGAACAAASAVGLGTGCFGAACAAAVAVALGAGCLGAAACAAASAIGRLRARCFVGAAHAVASVASSSAHLICLRMPRTGAVDGFLTQSAGAISMAIAPRVLYPVSGSALQGHGVSPL